MKEILEVMGVPGRSMLLERNSRNTYDNALYTAVVLNNKNIKRILLVTSAFHMRRAVALFEKQGFDVVPAISPNPGKKRNKGRHLNLHWIPHLNRKATRFP